MSSDYRTGLTGDAFSDRSGVRIYGTLASQEYRYPRARGNVVDYITDGIREMVTAERAIGKRHARKVAQCYSTPPSQVTPGPDGSGLGSWADGDLLISVRPEYGHPGRYRFTVYYRTSE